jgi:hypothetical protein
MKPPVKTWAGSGAGVPLLCLAVLGGCNSNPPSQRRPV